MTKAYRDSRKPFAPLFGFTYENQGGGTFECLSHGADENSAIMRNVKSGWTFVAHGIGVYEDAKIDWDYSTGGAYWR